MDVSYEQYEEQKYAEPMVEYHYLITQNEINEFFEDEEEGFQVDEDFLQQLNEFILKLNRHLASFLNVFQLIINLDKHSILENTQALKETVILRLQRSDTSLEIYNEILLDTIVEIQQMFMMELPYRNPNEDVESFVQRVLNVNSGLQSYVNEFSIIVE